MKRSARADRRGKRGASGGAGDGTTRTERVATVSVESIAAGGDGVARIDGLACFVPRAAPGDVVQIVYTTHARFARGRILQILESSEQRVVAPCAHYIDHRCGGCRLQHLSLEAQHDAIRHMVRDAMQRVGHRDIPLPDITSGLAWGYRERLTLTVRQKGGAVIAGLHAHDDPTKVFALTECPVSHPVVMEVWRAMRGHLRGVPAVTAAADPVRISLRLGGQQRNQVAVVVQGGSRWPDAAEWAGRIQALSPVVSAVWWMPAGINATPRCLSGATLGAVSSDDIDQSADADDGAGSDDVAFAQINSSMARALSSYVFEVVVAATPTSVIDAYCGQGNMALALATAGIRVTAIESDSAATAMASQRLQAWPDSRVISDTVEGALPNALPADVVLVNPPRRGLDPLVSQTLANAADIGVRRLVYVSCDPATLARDVARLPRWRIASVQCFDMFPHTAHVETVCVLVPEES